MPSAPTTTEPPVLARIARLGVPTERAERLQRTDRPVPATTNDLHGTRPQQPVAGVAPAEMGSAASIPPTIAAEPSAGSATTTRDVAPQRAELPLLVAETQTLLRPLARIIVLAALLTAAGLAYLLIEGKNGPAVHSGPPVVPTPLAQKIAPVASALPTPPADAKEEDTPQSPSVIGPAGDYVPRVVSRMLPSGHTLAQPALAPQPDSSPLDRAPSAETHVADGTWPESTLETRAITATGPAGGAYPSTGAYPVTAQRATPTTSAGSYPPIPLPAPPKPTAVAELIGTIESPTQTR